MHAHTLSLFLTHTCTHTLSHTYVHARTLSHTHTHKCTHAHSLSLALLALPLLRFLTTPSSVSWRTTDLERTSEAASVASAAGADTDLVRTSEAAGCLAISRCFLGLDLLLLPAGAALVL